VKIISINTSVENPEIGMFDYAITFKPYDEKTDPNNEDYLNQICEWVVNSFNYNFVIIEHASSIVAGGWVDNKDGWMHNNSKVDRNRHSSLASYELRCHSVDASLFKLRWS
jgi:hypothetical protein